MALTLQILAGLFAVLFIVMGAGFLFDPMSNAASVAVTPVAEHGLNTLRGDLGGLFIGSALLISLGLIRRRRDWLLAVAILMLCIAGGRVIGFIVDGNPAEAALVAFGFEIVIATVMILAARKLTPASR